MLNVPESNGNSRKSTCKNDDFPDPTGPIIPISFPLRKSTLIFCKVGVFETATGSAVDLFLSFFDGLSVDGMGTVHVALAFFIDTQTSSDVKSV